MAQRLQGRREVQPPRRPGERKFREGPTMGKMNVSVPISFGLPIAVVGGVLLLAASTTGRDLFWFMGAAGLALGIALFASGKRL